MSGRRGPPSSFILVDDQTVADLDVCIHCGRHFKRVVGSGKVRGWCHPCAGALCSPACDKGCDRGSEHFMRKIEAIEAGKRNPRDL